MSVMCRMKDSCCATKGMCIHEKMMLGMMVVGMLAAVAHWVFKLF